MTPDARPRHVVNAMTVDVEDYFHVSNFAALAPPASWPAFSSRVEANTDRLLAIFAEANVRATFFVLAWVAERHPGLVARIADLGHEVASHGYWHQLIYQQSRDLFRDDVRTAKAVLEDVSGRAVHGYRAPSFSVTRRSLWALDVLVEEGYTYDASIFPIRHHRYGIADADRHAFVARREHGSLVEVPSSTVRVAGVNLPIGGGAYFRLLPYQWTAWGMARVNEEEGKPAVFYLHPWEIDPGQPRLPASWMSKVRHYANLHATEARLRRLLGQFAFGTMRELIDAVPVGEPTCSALSGT